MRWADVVCVMEPKHRDRLRATHRRLAEDVAIVVLGIPDDYRFMAPELVTLLEELVPAALAPHLEE